jgi:hypothetical protein
MRRRDASGGNSAFHRRAMLGPVALNGDHARGDLGVDVARLHLRRGHRGIPPDPWRVNRRLGGLDLGPDINRVDGFHHHESPVSRDDQNGETASRMIRLKSLGVS